MTEHARERRREPKTRPVRPNILWIVGEDCPPRFGCYGDELAHTPAIDALARRGVLYERAYSNAPVCAPSRFSLLTGIPAESHAPADRMRASATRPEWMLGHPELMRSTGYYTVNNAKTDYNLDVDESEIWDASSPEAHWRTRAPGQPFLAVFNFDPTHESSLFDSSSPVARAAAALAARMPDRRIPAIKDLPLGVPPEEVRVPQYLPDTEPIRRDIARTYTLVRKFDEFVGLLLSQLEDDGLTDDTIVILTSDHGGITPRSKRYCYDEGLHVPLILAAPPQWASSLPAPGSSWPEPVSTVSLPSTTLDAAAIDVPAYMSAPSLLSARSEEDDAMVFSQRNRMDERFSLVRTVRSRRYRYIRTYTPHRPTIQYQAFAWNAEGYRSWEEEHIAGRLSPESERMWNSPAPVQLYDLDSDPDELRNLAGTPGLELVERRLADALRQHILDVHDNGFLPEYSDVCGWDASRAPDAYPLERILSIADLGFREDPGSMLTLTAALMDTHPTVRRWAALGILRRVSAAAATRPPVALREPIARLCEHLSDLPEVAIPAAEAVARATSAPEAIDTLLELAAPGNDVGIRLEAVDALTALPQDLTLPRLAAIEDAGRDADEYLGNAIRYLVTRLQGRYTPDAQIYSIASLLAQGERARSGLKVRAAT
ncbi:sulfatase [Microbacterium sp. MYb64]|uniref:sulfatase family protein n=1 Tax=Microbacterium sp. MYb64 TaxID=1848691 RepID=UPI000CFAC57C|nr:sulfatase [Microbacterium sp. MYb64]PRB03443.1 sulfatase [Microbacterium sp. MYb64]